MSFAAVPIMQVRGEAAVIYYQPLFSRSYCNQGQARLRMNRARLGEEGNGAGKGAYSGKMSPGAKKRMVKAITLMCQATKAKWIYNEVTGKYQYHRLSFVTLTVANAKNLTAREGYHKLLKHFLQWLRRTKGVKMYIWKAELQKRGQIHYHITMPDFIHYREIRDEWNRLQKDAGLLEEFAAKHGHADPNGTDIHEVKKTKNIAHYMVKELTKSIQNETATDGKLWDCSNNLSGAGYFEIELTQRHEEILKHLEATTDCRVVSGDWWRVIYFSDASPPDLLTPGEKELFEKHIEWIITDFEDLQQPEIPVECLAVDLDPGETFTPQQMQLFLN